MNKTEVNMKNEKINKLIILFGSMLLVTLIVSFSIPQDKQPLPWDVPDEYVNMDNPVEPDQSSINTGKQLYMKHCASCHGRTGKGDGPKARRLETFSGDFTKEAYQKQSDGEMFYKTKFGRDEMPGYEDKLSDKDIWHMVNYMRTFDD
jgi:mono/diheme cytochrome c family protein